MTRSGSPDDWYSDDAKPAKPTRPQPKDFDRADLDRQTHQFSGSDEDAHQRALAELSRMGFGRAIRRAHDAMEPDK